MKLMQLFIVNKYSKSMLTEIFNNYADLKIGKKISNEIQKNIEHQN